MVHSTLIYFTFLIIFTFFLIISLYVVLALSILRISYVILIFIQTENA